MSAPPAESADAAARATQNYIDTEMAAAVSAQIAYENNGGKGYSDDALTHFGHAEHTITDETSPEHAGYQPWYCSFCRSGVEHIRAEGRSAVSSAAKDEEARHLAYVRAAWLWQQFQAQLAEARKKQTKQKQPCPKDKNGCRR